MEKEIMSKINELAENDNEELAFNLLLSQGPDNGDTYNVFGVIGYNVEERNLVPFIEIFHLIKCWEDLQQLNLRTIGLRHRFNPQRNYHCFGVKVTEEHFKVLEANLNENNTIFAEWIESLNLDYFKLRV